MKEKELDDIRRTLQRIQRIASEPIDETDDGDGLDSFATPVTDAAGRPRDRPFGAQHIVEDAPKSRFVLFAIAALAVLGAVGMASYLLVGLKRELGPTPPITKALRVEPEKDVTASVPDDASRVHSEAQTLLEAGHVIEARRSLMGLPVKSPEAALILARSYDPNYLRLIPNVDAAADPTEAERWYRTWRDIASEQGLVLEPDRFDRIIKAMR